MLHKPMHIDLAFRMYRNELFRQSKRETMTDKVKQLTERKARTKPVLEYTEVKQLTRLKLMKIVI